MKKPVTMPDRRRTRTRHRKVIAAALAASAVAGSCLAYLYARPNDAVAVDAAAYYQFVSAKSGNALDVAGSDNADGVRIQQEQPARLEHAPHLVDRTLRLGHMLEHLGAQDYVEGVGSKTECSGIPDDVHAGTLFEIDADTLREMCGVRPGLRAEVQRQPAARV